MVQIRPFWTFFDLSKSWLERLLQEPPQRISQELLVHLPVAKDVRLVSLYMPLITKLLDEALRTDTLLEESRSILAYALLHPLFEGQGKVCHFSIFLAIFKLCELKTDEYREALIRYVKELQTRMITPESGGYCSSSNASCTDYSDTDSSDESVDEETVPDQAG